MIIGERLRFARNKKGLSQSLLARKAGITPSAISQIESGASKKPSANNLLPLARILDVDPNWLITGEGEMFSVTDIQQRIRTLMKKMTAFDLVAACDGRIAVETVDLWLCGAAEPTDQQLELIAEPLSTSVGYLKHGIHEANERPVHAVYDGRGEPMPENLSQMEIDIVRDLRVLNADKQETAYDLIHCMAEKVRTQIKKEHISS